MNPKDVTIEMLKEDNPKIDYENMSVSDLEHYKRLYTDGINLEQMKESTRGSIDLADFNVYFLAYFMNSENLTDQNRADLTTQWVLVADGTGCVPVDVMENGSVAFVIPPIYDTNNLTSSTDGQIGGVMGNYRVNKDRSNMAGEDLVNNMLDFMQDKTNVGVDDPWGSFKQFYGIYAQSESSIEDPEIDIFA